MPKLDLHFHSTYSDGKSSVPELAAIIKEKKLEYCALADHNTVAGLSELMSCLKGTGTKVIPATELTTKFEDNEVHILTYDFDIDEAAIILSERNEFIRNEKIEEMRKAIKLHINEGLEVTSDLVPSEKQPVSLTVALDICANGKNQELFQQKFGKQFMPEDVYYTYQAPDKPCFVERSGVTVEWVVEKFKKVARDIIIAHPFVSVSVVTKPLDEARINKLLQIGVTGIEVYHNDTSQEQIEYLKKLVHEQAIHFTGGSDYHGKPTDTPIGQYGPTELIPDFLLTGSH